jgi:hypothetical protein
LSYDENLFNTCSVEVQKIYLFLIKDHETTIRNIPSSIAGLKAKGAKITSEEKFLLEELEERKIIEFNSMDSTLFMPYHLLGRNLYSDL